MTAGAHTAALIAASSLAGILALVVAITTPWRPLPGVGGDARPDPARDLTSDEIARALRYVHAGNVPALLARALTLAMAAGLGFSKLGSRIAGQVGGELPWPLRVVTVTGTLLLITALVALPFRAWSETINRRFGLSVQTWRSWAVDLLRALAISGILAGVALVGLVALARAFPRWWWAAAASGGAAIVVAMSFLFPVIIEPLFNRFTPLPAGTLRDDLMALGVRDGLTVSDVLVADASRRTTALNAYVSGFGATRRIVVYDTLLQRPADEVRLVVAHELGHAADGDVLHSTIFGVFIAAISACLLGFSLSSALLLQHTGIDGPADTRSIALVLGLLAVFGAVMGPVAALVSRRLEARADLHALDAMGDAGAFMRTMRELAVTNLANPRPHPLLHLLFADHPSIPQRMAFARTWAHRGGLPVPLDLAGLAVQAVQDERDGR